MKFHFLITVALISWTSTLSGADPVFDTSTMAAQISANPILLQELETLSNAPNTTRLRGNSVMVQSILATLDPHELQQMLAKISRSLHRNDPSQRSSASISPKPASRDQVVAPAASATPNTGALLAGRPKYDLDGQKIVRFNVAPLGDCGLLSLPINLSRADATQRIEGALAANRFDADDARYLKDQHHHLATEGQSLQQKHLKLIGVLLGFNVRFFSDVGGMLIEDTDIRIKTKVPGLTDVLIFDGEGHFEALIPTSNQAALQRAYETEQTSKRKTAEFQRQYQ